MEELKEEIKQIEDLWKKVYDVCVATPSLYTPHLPNLTVDEVGGVVLTVLQWMKALDTNRKGKNTYILSKSVMITSLNATITNLKNISNISSSLKQIKDFSEKIPNIQTSNEEAQKSLNQLIEKAKEVNKALEELLPGSTSAGLASSFYNKVQQLKWSKRCLLSGFIVSILALSYLTMPMLDTSINQDTSIWKEFFHRLPLLFPPIWLGWFFARSYGHANRLQEKYAYKEAMSRAFQGYRKQMEEVIPNYKLSQNYIWYGEFDVNIDGKTYHFTGSMKYAIFYFILPSIS